MTVLNLQVGAAGDDRQQDDNTTTSSSALITVGTQLTTANPRQHNLWRFTNVTVPQGATINSATFSIRKETTEWKRWDVTFYGLDEDTITSVTGRIDTRAKTTASTVIGADSNHTAGTWVAIDVTAQIQEIVNRSGWSSGNNTAIIAQGTGSYTYATKTFNDYSDNATYAAKLDIDYSAGAATQNIDANFIATASVLYGADVLYDQILDCNFIASASVLYGPTIAYAQTLDANFISVSSVTYGGDVALVTSQELSNATTVSMGTSGPLDNLGPDGITWPQAKPLYQTQYGKLFFLAQDYSGNNDINFAYSNNDGISWTSTVLNPAQGYLSQRAFAVDEAHKIVHVLFTGQNSSDGVIYRRYTWTEDGSHNITDFTRDTNVNLQLDANSGATYVEPSMIWLDDAVYGTYGAIVAFWGARGSTNAELRTSMRILSNTSADNTAGNWIATGSSDSDTIGITPNVAFTHPVAYAHPLGVWSTVSLVPSGENAHDIIIVYHDGNYAVNDGNFRSLRMIWNSSDNKWTNGYSSTIDLGAITQSGANGGYLYKYQLISQLAYLSDNDSFIIGLPYWKDNTDGDSWAFREIYNDDTASSIHYVYSGLAANCDDYVFVTGDVAVDSVSQEIVVSYTDLPDKNIYVSLYDSSLTAIQSDILASDARPFDIPCMYARISTDQVAIITRDFNDESVNVPPTYTPPYQGYFITLDWSAGASAQNINAGFLSSGSVLYNATINVTIPASFISSSSIIYGSDLEQTYPAQEILAGFISAISTTYGCTVNTSFALNAGFISSNSQIYGATTAFAIATGFIESVSVLYGSLVEFSIHTDFIESVSELYGSNFNISFNGAFIDSSSVTYGSSFGTVTEIVANFIDSTITTYGATFNTIVEIITGFIDSISDTYGATFNIAFNGAFIESQSVTYGGSLLPAQDISGAFLPSDSELYGSQFAISFNGAYISIGSNLYGAQFDRTVLGAFIESESQIYGGTFGSVTEILASFISAISETFAPTFSTSLLFPTDFIDSSSITYGGLFIGANEILAGFIDSISETYGAQFAISFLGAFINSTSQLYGATFEQIGADQEILAGFIDSSSVTYSAKIDRTLNAAVIESAILPYGGSFTGANAITAAFIDSISQTYNARIDRTFLGSYISNQIQVFGSDLNSTYRLNSGFVPSASITYGARFDRTLLSAFISSNSQTYGGIFNAGFLAAFIESSISLYPATFSTIRNLQAAFISSGFTIYSARIDRTVLASFIDSSIVTYAPLYLGTEFAQFVEVGFIAYGAIIYGAYILDTTPILILDAQMLNEIVMQAQMLDEFILDAQQEDEIVIDAQSR